MGKARNDAFYSSSDMTEPASSIDADSNMDTNMDIYFVTYFAVRVFCDIVVSQVENDEGAGIPENACCRWSFSVSELR